MKKDEKTDKKFLLDEFKGILKGTEYENYTAEDIKEERTKKYREDIEKITQKGGDSSTGNKKDS